MVAEQLLVAGLVGFSSAAIGVIVGQAVMKEKISSINKVVDSHAENFKRVVWRDECAERRASCEKHGDEWREEMIKRMEKLEGALRSCFEDLVKELRR